MGFYSVKNFEHFQHYGDSRAPIWIKLYNKLLDDYAFSRLPDVSKAHLMLIWLLASQNKNRIPDDPAWIARRIGATEAIDFNTLISSEFIDHCIDNQESASNLLATNEPPASKMLDQNRGEESRERPLSACADVGVVGEKDSASRPSADSSDETTRPAKSTRTKKPAKDAKPEHGAVKAYFCERWKNLRSSGDAVNYPWKHGRDDKHTKWILDQVDRDPEKAKTIIEAFLRDDDEWLVDKGHDIGLLVSKFAKYRARRTVKPEAADNGFVRCEVTAEHLRAAYGEEAT